VDLLYGAYQREPGGALHPVLRAQLFFASAEARALTFEKPHVGLRAGLSSWPRFSSEPPEIGWNLVQWLRRRRAVWRKRHWLRRERQLLRELRKDR